MPETLYEERHGVTAIDRDPRYARSPKFGRGSEGLRKRSSLAVWEVMMFAKSYNGDLDAVARHLQWPLLTVEAAANYAMEFPERISLALIENSAADFDSLKRMFLEIKEFRSSSVAYRWFTRSPKGTEAVSWENRTRFVLRPPGHTG